MRKLFLDDYRVPEDVTKYINPSLSKIYENNGEWYIVRNFDEFCSYINEHGIPEVVSFDHDLADEHYAPTGISYNDFKEKTGYHCMNWLIDRILDNKITKLPEVYIHSLNPVGAENMEMLWENFKDVWDTSNA